jgi:uncharacterized protein
MHYHLILTSMCNSKCRYCYEKSMEEENDLGKKWKFDFSCPTQTSVDVKKLKDFLEKDKDAVLIFYGGEPLLEIKKIKEIIDEIDVPFRMQTNGKLLDKIPIEYLKKIDKVLISVDGDEGRTDFNRGKGTYKKVLKNLNLIREKGYRGEIVARMTLDFPDIFEQVKHLLEIGFDSIHWQLDAGFYKCDFDEDNFKKFVNDYNESVSKLIDFWIKDMEKNKRVLMIYPFVGIFNRLIGWDKNNGLMCGAGEYGFAIDTNGKIIACPIMNCIEDFVCGDIYSNDLKKIFVSGRCDKCEVKSICGGRCLYWNKANLWPEKGDDLICETIKFLIDEIKDKIPIVEKYIENGLVSKKDFEYEKYFGPEIIP